MKLPINQDQNPFSGQEQRLESSNASHLAQINENAAGIDLGSAEHWVCVPPLRDEKNVRRFGCFTPDLMAMADWLSQCGVTSVAMEATGVYWIPVFQILETRGFEVKLVNAHHLKTVPGRKTDVKDCQWLQQLHTYGLLSGSFRPEDQVCILRSYIRQRECLIKSAGTHLQRMQKALIQMNLHLHQVISDISGLTGMTIIKAIVAGERDPQKLAALKDPRIKSSKTDIAKALTGDYRPEHLFVLNQELTLYEVYQQQIAAIDKEIEKCLNTFEIKVQDEPPPSKRKRRKKPVGNNPNFDLRKYLYHISGVDFTLIDGLDVLTVQTIFSEVGLDPKRFPTVKHFTSWLGLCPGQKITGGKVKSSQTRRVVNRAASAFRMAAFSLTQSRSALGAFYRRLRSRLGAPKAITATAHKLARLFYQMWATAGQYTDPGMDYYEQKYQELILKNLRNKAHALGLEIVPISPEQQNTLSSPTLAT
ncbi:IS110 family transposase [Nostoc sp. FACHB-888]|uniref:IS110 family transposase n=1 Tax=Nostoc sp. FACHB-888 TaxID=2692842 RepID=UPI001F54C1DC|nr:IS110 family transposase [Nostoc sp. FACHB-888]